MSVKQSFLSCQPSLCAHGARSDRVIIKKRTRDCIQVCRQLSHEITKKAIKAANCMHVCMHYISERLSNAY